MIWKQCNFSLTGGNATGKYHFQAGLSGLTEEAKILTLANCEITDAYLDDILIVTKGSKEVQNTFMKNINKLDEDNLAKWLEKCKLACKQAEWLGYNINSERTWLLIRKREAKEKLTAPEKTFFN